MPRRSGGAFLGGAAGLLRRHGSRPGTRRDPFAAGRIASLAPQKLKSAAEDRN